MRSAAALLTVLLPVTGSLLGFWTGRRRSWATSWAVLGTLGAFIAACVETIAVIQDGASVPLQRMSFLGTLDIGFGTGATGTSLGTVDLTMRSDWLSAYVAVAVGLVACCVQIYSSQYLHGEGTPDAPTRYRPYASTVSIFTAAMMIVIHADNLVLLMVGWEIMGICSYLLVGHHSERDSARRAAVKAFLVTRVGDLGVLLAVALLLVSAHTTSISRLIVMADTGKLSTATATASALLLLAGVCGKSAQFPLHTWLPDAMEGPTPVSALIHAATMVAAGVFLVARVLPIYLHANAALAVAGVIAGITMLGAAIAAVAQDDFKRLLAYSTVSQVALMLAGVAIGARYKEYQVGIYHLLTHAGFKALLFLVAGVVTHLAGSTKLKDLGGLWVARRGLAILLALGLAALAGIWPLSGFYSKEAVLTTIENAAVEHHWGVAWFVMVCALLTTVFTGLYAGRALAIVCGGLPVPGSTHHVAREMNWPLVALAVPTVGLGLLYYAQPPGLAVTIGVQTALVGLLLSLVGLGWGLTGLRLESRDIADILPVGLRAFLCDGYRFDDLQNWLVVRPVIALARATVIGDRDVVDAYVRATPAGSRWAGILLRKAQTGLATGYATWIVLGVVIAGVAGVVLS